MPLDSLGGSPRSAASGFDPDSFQTTASVLGLVACEILCVPFKSGASVSYSPLTLLYTSPAGLQSQMFWVPVQDPRLGRLMPGLDPSLLGENLCDWDYPPFCGCLPRGVGLDCTTSPPLLPVSLWLLLYFFNCGKSLC